MRRLFYRLVLPLGVLILVAIVAIPRWSGSQAGPAPTAPPGAGTTLPDPSASTTPGTPPSSSIATTTTIPEIAVTFAAGGDLGATELTAEVLATVKASAAQFMLALGDLSYNQIKPESAWCDWVHEQLGQEIPMEVLVGNHEDDGGPDGLIGNFSACMPDHMRSTGAYGVEYFFDVDDTVRVIMLAADTRVDGEKYNYEPGSDQEKWLVDAIREARRSGTRWVVVGTHKPCLTVGEKECESGEHLAQLLIDEGVDLVLYGHDHNYQRTHQLSCVTVDSFDPACVANDTDDLVAGAGTVFVVAGVTGKTSLYKVDANDSEAPYFAAFLGPGEPDPGHGYVEVAATQDLLEMRFVGVTTPFEDGFRLRY